MTSISDKAVLKQVIEDIVATTEVTDIHTHIYSEAFNELLLYGVDELITYHYLIAEYFRYSTMSYDDFFKLSKREQADLIWQTLFIDHSPISEAHRGVLTVLAKLGLDVESRDLAAYRAYFDKMSKEEYINKVFELSGVKEVVMTNDPFDPLEKPIWDSVGNQDSRFKAALRVDPLLNTYDESYLQLQQWGYTVDKGLDDRSIEEVKRFLK
ncbi:MAG: glucuronate isomerase, partial [Bacillota bacterium]|nr:glucuronate isomerase [Bacillota bacterium]